VGIEQDHSDLKALLRILLRMRLDRYTDHSRCEVRKQKLYSCVRSQQSPSTTEVGFSVPKHRELRVVGGGGDETFLITPWNDVSPVESATQCRRLLGRPSPLVVCHQRSNSTNIVGADFILC